MLRAEALYTPSGVALHNGSVYVLEQVNANSDEHESWPPRVRKISADGAITTLANWQD